MKTLKEHSKASWITEAGKMPNLEQINTGSLQRIADATEAMAINHNRLIQENEWLKLSRSRCLSECDYLTKSNASLKGHMTRLKKKIAKLEAIKAGE